MTTPSDVDIGIKFEESAMLVSSQELEDGALHVVDVAQVLRS